MYAGKPLFHPSLDPPDGKFGYAASYELLRAARWRGYRWAEFDALDTDEQALIIAEYRIELRYQAVDAWANRPKDTDGAGGRQSRRGKRG